MTQPWCFLVLLAAAAPATAKAQAATSVTAKAQPTKPATAKAQAAKNPAAENPAAKPAAIEDREDASDRQPQITITKDERQVRLTLSGMPPSRTRVTLVSKSSGHQAVVDWDPAAESSLSQVVRLPPLAGTASSETYRLLWSTQFAPIRRDAGEVDRAWILSGQEPGGGVFKLQCGDGSARVNCALLYVDKNRLSGLASGAKQLGVSMGGAAGGRALLSDSLTTAVDETLRLLAEIAMDRARSKATGLLMERVRTLVCDEVRFPTQLEADAKKYVTTYLSSTQQEAPGRPLIRTCAVMQTLRFEEITSGGRALFRALLSDLLLLTSAGVEVLVLDQLKSAELQPLVKHGIEASRDLLLRTAAGNAPPSLREFQLLLIALTDDLKLPKAETKAPAVACAVAVVLAALSDCQARESCDARDLHDMLIRPGNHFDVEQECAPTFKEGKLIALWPDIQAFASRGLEVVRPPPQMKPSEQALRAIGFVLDLAVAVLRAQGGDSPPSEIKRALLIVEQLRNLTTSVVTNDLAAGVLAATEVVRQAAFPTSIVPLTFDCVAAGQVARAAHVKASGEPSDEASRTALEREEQQAIDACLDQQAKSETTRSGLVVLERGARILAGLGNYAHVYDSTRTQDAATAKEARKRSLESLIDSMTQRTDRPREVVFSLGANVGFGGFMADRYRYPLDPFELKAWGQLTLPMGLALDWLPDSQDARLGFVLDRALGVHAQLAIIDLGQYLALDGSPDPTRNVHWDDLLCIGGQLGVAVGRPNDVFVIGFDVRYSPTIFREKAAPWRFGIFASYYVPFIDLN